MLTRTIHVSGTVVGRLWWPVGEPASLHVSAEIVPSDETVCATGGPYPDLRTALVELANPGDLASAGFLPGSLIIEVRTTLRSATAPPVIRSRFWNVRGRCWATDDLFADAALAAEFQ